MDARLSVDTIEILNLDQELSNISHNKQVVGTSTDDNSSNKLSHKSSNYIVSDADEEILILIKFKSIISLRSIKIYANSDDINIDEEEDISPPKQMYVYKLQNLNINFDDINSLKPNKSFNCLNKKLKKGQKINLQNNSKLALTFKSIQYLAIYIKSNQNESEKTFINKIELMVEAHADSNRNSDIVSRSHTVKILKIYLVIS